MAYTKLKELDQGKFLGEKGYSSSGVCYYICEHVQEKVWNRPVVGAFDKAVEAAKNVVPATIIKAAKAKNLSQKGGDDHGVAQRNYGTLATPLRINSLYRVGLWFGEAGDAPDDADDQNHEAIVITGSGAEIVFLEPNWGFYQGDADFVAVTNKDVFEAAVRALYDGNGHDHAENFHYERIRGL